MGAVFVYLHVCTDMCMCDYVCTYMCGRTCVYVYGLLPVSRIPLTPSAMHGGKTVCVNAYANVHFVSMFVRACVYAHVLL